MAGQRGVEVVGGGPPLLWKEEEGKCSLSPRPRPCLLRCTVLSLPQAPSLPGSHILLSVLPKLPCTQLLILLGVLEYKDRDGGFGHR